MGKGQVTWTIYNYFLKAMSGEGNKNKDSKVSDSELKNYLGETITHYARRYY